MNGYQKITNRTLNNLTNLNGSSTVYSDLTPNTVAYIESDNTLGNISNGLGYLHNDNSGNMTWVYSPDEIWGLSNFNIYTTDASNHLTIGNIYTSGYMINSIDNNNYFGFDTTGLDTFTVHSAGSTKLTVDATAGTTIHGECTIYADTNISGDLLAMNVFTNDVFADNLYQDTLVGDALLDMTTAGKFSFKPNGTTTRLAIDTTGVNLTQQTASTLPQINGSKYITSITNASGFLLNSGAGTFSYRYPLISDVSGLQINLSGLVDISSTQTITGVKTISNSMYLASNIIHLDPLSLTETSIGFSDLCSNYIMLKTNGTTRLDIESNGNCNFNNKVHLKELVAGAIKLDSSDAIVNVTNQIGYLHNDNAGGIDFTQTLCGSYLNVTGVTNLSGLVTTTNGVNVGGALNAVGTLGIQGNSNLCGTLVVNGVTTLSGLLTCNNGAVVNTATLSASQLYVNTTSLFNGVITLSSNLVSKNPTVFNITCTQDAPILFNISNTNIARFTNGTNPCLCIGGGTPSTTSTRLDVSGVTFLRGATNLCNTLNVLGAATFSGGLLTNSCTISSNLYNYGNSYLCGTLNVLGSTTFSGGVLTNSCTISSNLYNYGSTYLCGTLNVLGATNISGKIQAFNDVGICGVLYCLSNAHISGGVHCTYVKNPSANLNLIGNGTNDAVNYQSSANTTIVKFQVINDFKEMLIRDSSGTLITGVRYCDNNCENDAGAISDIRGLQVGPDANYDSTLWLGHYGTATSITNDINTIHSKVLDQSPTTGAGTNVVIRGSAGSYRLAPTSSKMSTKTNITEVTDYKQIWDDIKIYRFLYKGDEDECINDKCAVGCAEYYYNLGYIMEQCEEIDHIIVNSDRSNIKDRTMMAIMHLKIRDIQTQVTALQSMQYVTDLQTKTTELQNNIIALQVQYNDLQIKVSTLQNQVSVINTQLNIY